VNPRLLALTGSILVVFGTAGPAAAQLMIPGVSSEAVAIPLDRDEKSQTRASLQKAEEDFRRDVDRLQEQFRWQVERLEQRRSTLAEQRRSWRSRRTSLGRRPGDARLGRLDNLLVLARDLDRLQRDLQESYDSHLRALLDAESAARSLQLELEQGVGFDSSETTSAEIDTRLEGLDLDLNQARRRLTDLENSRRALESSADDHRDELNAALLLMFQAEGPSSGGSEGGATPPVSAEEAAALDELLSLADEEHRLTVSIREFQGELDRARLAVLGVQLARTQLPIGFETFRKAQLQERRAAVASREKDGVFNVSTALWDPAAIRAGLRHTQTLLSQPRQTATALLSRAVSSPGPQADRGGLLGIVALLGMLAMFAATRCRRWVIAMRPRSVTDALVLRSALGMLPVLPLSLISVLLVGLDLVPLPLVPLTRFSAVAPPLVVGFLCSGAVLFPIGGSDVVDPSVARYMRSLIRLGALLACLIGLSAALMPLLGYPASVLRLLKAALALWLLFGWIGMLLRRNEVLALLGADGDVAQVGVLRAGIRRFYRVFVFGPVAVYILYAFGYVNLAQLLVRGGLVTVSVMLLAPWLHEKLRELIAKAVGYPDGGGWLALRPEGARAAFRSAAPLTLLAVGGASLALVASGWDYGGNLLTNLVSALTFPLLDVGGSQITGLSLVLLAFTIAVTFLVTRWVLQQLNKNLYPIYDLDRATKTTLDSLVRYVLIGVGLVISLDVVGVGVGILTVFAGVIGIGLGFGSQTLVANFMAGLVLLVTRRISVEDVIEVDGQVGRVVRISSFSTAVRTLDNLEVIVPNSKLIESSVTNWTGGESPVRLAVKVEAAYGSDVALVRRLLLQVAHEDPRVLENPSPLVRFDEFGSSGLLFTLAPWIEDAEERFMVSSDLRFRIDRVFREHGVEIPFAQQDVHIRTGDGMLKVELSRASEGEAEGGP
jgi:small-conductance mechanosensitive channel